MKIKALKLSCAFFCVAFAMLASVLCVSADTQTLQDGGYYVVSDAEGTARLSVSENGDVFAADSESEKTLIRLSACEDGGYSLSPAARGGYLYLSADGCITAVPEEGACEIRLYADGTDAFYSLCTERDGGVCYISLSESAEGERKFSVTDERTHGWRADICRPEKMAISMNSIKTRPYVTYTDLRATTEPAYLASYVEWDTSDRRVLIIDGNGDFCALTEGNATVTATLGGVSLKCEVNVSHDNKYAWYSQNNISTGGWNGDAVKELFVIGNGVKKRFAANGSTKKTDWMSEGCSLCSIAQVLNNMGARYTDGYDFRSGISGNIMADPYTVALANLGHKGPEQGNVTLYGDPIMTRHNAIAAAFNVKGKTVTVKQKYAVNKKALKEALDECPWGVIVCFENKAYGTHYITFNRCLNPNAENPNDYIFTVTDPAAIEPRIASDTVFEESYAYKILHYRLGQAQLMQIWSYEEQAKE